MEALRFVLLGLGIGAIYAMVAQGLVLIYRGSGVVNFAQGAFVMIGAYAYYELKVNVGLPSILAVAGAVLIGAILGATVHLLILRPMVRSSPVERVIATLGVLITLQAAITLYYGVSSISVPSALPTEAVKIGQVSIGEDRLIILGLGVLATIILASVYRFTSFGRLASAVAENQRVAASLGHSPDKIATANWALGAALAAFAGSLIAPISFLQPITLTGLVVPALAAGLVGRFSSFSLAFIGSLAIGVAESLMTRYITTPGWSDSVPFVLIVLMLVLGGTSLPLRSFVFDRLPPVGDGRVRWIPLGIALVVMGVLLGIFFPPTWILAFTVTMVFGLFCLSVVVVTGYAGQLSLAQFVFGGVGAFAAAKLIASQHVPFLAAALLAVVIAVVVGLIVALPALRTRGVNLAIATFGLGIVVFSLVLSSSKWGGGDTGIQVGNPTLFGWDFDSIKHPSRYALVVLAVLTLAGLVVTNVRRGRTGRRLLAVRSNERAAAALGVNIFVAKLFAFGLSAALAGIAGILLAFQGPNIIPSQFDVMTSITVVGVTVVGGLGTVGGALIGSTLLPGGVGTQLLHDLNGLQPYLPLISGLFLLYVLRTGNGLYGQNAHLVRLIGGKLMTVWRRRAAGHTDPTGATASAHTMKSGESPKVAVAPSSASEHGRKLPASERPKRDVASGIALRAADVQVRFGSVAAVGGVDLEILAGEVHGLIGPNGAGKTTMIDALTGFVTLSAGSVKLGDTEVGRWNPRRRARAGIARSFQSVELFSDLSVRENIAVACDSGGLWRYLSDLIWPGRLTLSPVAELAIRDFRLQDVLDLKPDELDFGQRRLVAIARAVASDPRILLLDEPAAGLGDDEVAELSTLIRALARDWGIGVLLVEHNIDLVLTVCDRVTVLDVGMLLTSGSPKDVRDNPDVITAYLGSEAAMEPAAAGI
jgi:ABC-type branched-subunit amino acid transport system ATPase component/branched-subunit amino acid ABC-type transport system permease component